MSVHVCDILLYFVSVCFILWFVGEKIAYFIFACFTLFFLIHGVKCDRGNNVSSHDVVFILLGLGYSLVVICYFEPIWTVFLPCACVIYIAFDKSPLFR